MMQSTGTEFLRRRNRARVLSVLRKAGAVSHTELADLSGLSSASISKITGELVAEGIIEKKEDIKEDIKGAGRGRPRVLFQPCADAAYLADVRVVLDKIVFSLVDYAGTLKDRIETRRIFEKPDIDQFSSDLVAGLERLCDRSNLKRKAIKTISITSKGLVNASRSKLMWSPVFEHHKIDFSTLLGPEWDAVVRVTNETQFSSLAALEYRRKMDGDASLQRLATLSLGNGIGLGIAELDGDGQVCSFAPDVGHMIHQPAGPVCRCGSRGCIEAFAGFYGILRTGFDVPADTIPSKFVPLTEMQQVAEQARRGDRKLQHGFNKAGEAIGVGLARLISMYGSMPIVITGQGVSLFDLLEPELRFHLNEGLSVRLGAPPEIILIEDEINLIHEGNKSTSLNILDIAFADGASRRC